MPEVFGQGTNISITELTGEKRELVLGGRALPYRPIGFGGTMRAEFTWYPGNPTATVQVLGAQEDETSIHGKWKSKYLGEATTIGSSQTDIVKTAIATLDSVDIDNAMRLVQVVDDFRRKGQLLRFQWDVVIRKGILSKFTYEIDNRLDISWTMSFQWINQGEDEVPAVLSNQIDLASVSATWSSVAKRVKDSVLKPFKQLTNSLKTLTDKTDALLENVDGVAGTVSSVVNSATSSLQGAQRLAGVFDTVISKAEEVKSNLDAQWTSLQFSTTESVEQLTAPTNAAFYDRLINLSWEREVYESASEAQVQAALQKSDALKQITPNVVTTVIARFGQDLRDISTQAYGTPNEWRSLLAYNGFEQSELEAGQVVLVPKLDSVEG